ncbi:MAG TPA: RidA family protein [candidate division Zixibacteria bacterium]|nr:RidA family protein [candidate division Zixibacteria bacterium]
MTKQALFTDKAPAPIGPYSQAVKVSCGTMIFVSGQGAVDPQTGEIVGDTAAEQAEVTLKNLQTIITAAGAKMANVVKTTVFLKSMDDFKPVNEVYARYFSEPYPARAAVEAARLPKDILVEIEAILMV